jgi:O-antigen ligase
MMPVKERFDYYNTGIFILLMASLASLAFSNRIVNSISTITLAVIIFLHAERMSLFKQAFKDRYFISCLCFLLINMAGLLYTNDSNQNLKEFSIKAGIVAIPFFFCANSCRIGANLRHLMIAFTLCLLATTLYCIFHAFTIYRQHGDSSVFFYHTLLSPFNEHAVYYSFYLLFCIIYWMEEGMATFKRLQKKIFVVSVLVYFFLVIILLSSKIVLGILSVYILYFILSRLIHKQNKKILLPVVAGLGIIVAILVATNNPVKKRFSDITNGTTTLFQQQKFNAGVYFNGLQFRLLTWRFTSEILNEQEAWLLGVSAGDGQAFLRKKYIETNMYTGDGSNSGGYLLYNCHNIYLQTTLESGIIGLISLLSIIASFLFKLIKSKRKTTLIFFLCMLVFGFTESYLSRQFGIVLFTFLPLLALSAANPPETLLKEKVT